MVKITPNSKAADKRSQRKKSELQRERELVRSERGEKKI